MFSTFVLVLIASRFAPGQINTQVTFHCDMNVEITEGRFTAGADTLHVRGVFNDFDCEEMTDGDADGVYSVTIPLLNVAPAEYSYKFNINCSDGGWEGDPDKAHLVESSDPITVSRTFNSLTVLQPVEVLFRVDMSQEITNLNVTPGTDIINVAGQVSG